MTDTASHGITTDTAAPREARRRSSVAPASLTLSHQTLALRAASRFKAKMTKMPQDGSTIAPSSIQRDLKLENTYKMAPDPGHTFKAAEVSDMAERILTNTLRNFSYSPDGAGSMAVSLSALIKEKIKPLIGARYKLVCQVLISEAGDNSFVFCSRNLWNHTLDNHSTAQYHNSAIHAVCIIAATYYE